ncbi:MAG: 1,4-alpha-glucan branching enzyme GlgB [Pseudomonadota bacterium]
MTSAARPADPWSATATARTDAAALLGATHGDPFAVLGPHDGPGGARVVRCLRPGAASVEVLDPAGRALGALARLDGDLWAGVVALRAGDRDYRLRIDGAAVVDDPYRFGGVLGELDLHLLAQGTHWRAWRVLGAQARVVDGVAGTSFAVWAPNARRVSVVGPFVGWDGRALPMRRRIEAGVWELFVPGVEAGALYKYEVLGADGRVATKADPFARRAEPPPATASRVIHERPFAWTDGPWLADRARRQSRDAPIAIYEVHAGSWMRHADGRPHGWLELARELVPYAKRLGFTHLELMPVSEHPFGGSWGYQPTALYAPTARWGEPDDLRAFVDCAHAEGLGVILDWVPAHFPDDAHGLVAFDGTALYEHADPRVGRHADWGTLVYDFGRTEVANFLIANALYWLHEFHVDGLRVDAVASMLYLDYSRPAGTWRPNVHGGRENLEAVAFLKRLNEKVYEEVPGAVTIAEESTAWPGVSRPVWLGGLGFGYKWNMGWMNDTLAYVREDPVHRAWHHGRITFGLMYAFAENFVLPLSHDEVVHGKGSLIGKMPGDDWQRFATLRAYLAFMWTQPGKKLLFMGGEIGQWREWHHDRELDWGLLGDPSNGMRHRGLQACVGDLNRLYAGLPALHANDCEARGFEWIDCQDSAHSVVAWLRFGTDRDDCVMVACNFTPVPRPGYRLGVPCGGRWTELLNTDAIDYGGSGQGNLGGVDADARASHGRPWSVALTLPPLSVIVLRPGRDAVDDAGGAMA